VNPSFVAAYDTIMGDEQHMACDPIAELEAIEAARGKLAKAALLTSISPLARELIRAGVDPWQVWYVSGPPECDAPTGKLSGPDAVAVFLEVLGILTSGERRKNEGLGRADWAARYIHRANHYPFHQEQKNAPRWGLTHTQTIYIPCRLLN
jgi:hypothetical protein